MQSMWLKMDLSGILMKMRIYGYEPCAADDWGSKWCKTDFSFSSAAWLNYHVEEAEVFLSCELQQLAQKLEQLLDDRLAEVTEFSCMEPDFNFTLMPKRDRREDPNVIYVASGQEIADIRVAWMISFWHEGLTQNFLSVSLDRGEIEDLKNYLLLVSGQIEPSHPAIGAMLERGALCKGGTV